MQNLSSIYEDDISDSSLNSVPAAGMKLLRESTTDTDASQRLKVFWTTTSIFLKRPRIITSILNLLSSSRACPVLSKLIESLIPQ
jgi:hypothetical protein